MIKLLNWQKDSFTLLETLFSIILLSIVVSGFLYSTYKESKNQELYQILNELENSFNENDYKSLNKSVKSLNIIINSNESRVIKVNKYEYFDDNIRLIRYEK